MHADFVIHSAAQLVTCESLGGARRGTAVRDVSIIEDGAIAIGDGQIVAVGSTDEIRSTHDARRTIDDGCALALSTDHNPGSAPCLSPALVMAIVCRYQQLTPAEALNACTINAAHALGIGDSVGSLEVGKQADVLVVDAPDYRHLAYQFGTNLVERVIKRGRDVLEWQL